MTTAEQVTLTLSRTDLEALCDLVTARGFGYFGHEFTGHLLAQLVVPDTTEERTDGGT